MYLNSLGSALESFEKGLLPVTDSLYPTKRVPPKLFQSNYSLSWYWFTHYIWDQKDNDSREKTKTIMESECRSQTSFLYPRCEWDERVHTMTIMEPRNAMGDFFYAVYNWGTSSFPKKINVHYLLRCIWSNLWSPLTIEGTILSDFIPSEVTPD